MLTTIANIADLLAAAGVIGSLIFLGLQLREQNRETGLNNWRELLITLTDFKGITSDPQMADLVLRGHEDYHALGPAEKLSFAMYLEQGIHIIGNFEKHSGTVPTQMKDLHYPIRNLMLDHLATPGARAWWAESKPRGRFLPSNVEMIDRLQQPGQIPEGPHL